MEKILEKSNKNIHSVQYPHQREVKNSRVKTLLILSEKRF